MRNLNPFTFLQFLETKFFGIFYCIVVGVAEFVNPPEKVNVMILGPPLSRPLSKKHRIWQKFQQIIPVNCIILNFDENMEYYEFSHFLSKFCLSLLVGSFSGMVFIDSSMNVSIKSFIRYNS